MEFFRKIGRWLALHKVIAITTAVVLVSATVLTVVLVTRTPRSQILRIANWGTFMDASLRTEFEQYMRDVHDQRIRVRYTTYGSNEQLFNMMTRQRADFDLVVPSEYMVEKMITQNMLQPLDLNRLPNLTATRNIEVDGTTIAVPILDPAVIDPMIASEILGITGGVHFAIPYIYGTLGIAYDTSIDGLGDFIRDNGWRSLFNHNTEWFPAVSHVTERTWVPSVKNIGRDTFTVTMLAHYQEDILNALRTQTPAGVAEANRIFDEIFGGPTGTATQQAARWEEMLKTAEELLEGLHPNVFFEGPDQLLSNMIDNAGTGNARADFGIEWSVSAAHTMDWNHHVGFHVPEEGTNLWINSFVIPQAARNVDVAYKFIDFISRPDNVFTNIDYVRGTTPILKASADRLVYYRDEATVGTGANDTFVTEAHRQQFIHAMFPRQFETIVHYDVKTGRSFRYLGSAVDILIDLMLANVVATHGSR